MNVSIRVLLTLLMIPWTLIYAQSNYSVPKYLGAATPAELSIERDFFVAESLEQKADLIYAKAEIYLEQNRLQDALEIINRLLDFPYNKLRPIDIYRLAFVNHLAGNYDRTSTYLNEISYYDTSHHLDFDYHHLKVLNNVQKGLFDEARQALTKWIAVNAAVDSSNSDSVVSCLIPTNIHKKLKSERLASRLSLVPGAGQVYAGAPLRGLSSLVLFGGAVTYSALSMDGGYWITGIATGVSTGMLLWIGGSKHARYLTRKHNNEVKSKLLDDLIDFFNIYATTEFTY